MTPEVFPHVGFDNFKSMLWIWVPYTLYKNRPLTAESVKIIWMYRGVKTTAHMGFTTHADLCRRFGWPGIRRRVSLWTSVCKYRATSFENLFIPKRYVWISSPYSNYDFVSKEWILTVPELVGTGATTY